PSVAMDARGDFVAVWQSFGQDLSSIGVYGQRYDNTGAPQGIEFRANTFTPNFQYSPSVGMDAAGDFTVAWDSYTQDGSEDGIYAQRYNASGATLGGEYRVNTFITSAQTNPSVTMSAIGESLIAWESGPLFGAGQD